MSGFRYAPQIIARYPDVVGGVIVLREVQNKPSPTEFTAIYQAEQKAVKARIGEKSLAEIESISAWRKAFREFGVEPTQYRCSAESLLRRLSKKGDIPGINLLVDIGYLVSIRHALPIAVMDTRAVEGVVTVKFADGSERYTELGDSQVKHPEVGEVVFTDDTGLVLARRWCWRQSEHSATREDSSKVLITIEAQHPQSKELVRAAQADFLELVNDFMPTSAVAGFVDKKRTHMP
jgi:DNA/RNA-binding domain of Phe-tRNA-synthetase-like protein